MIATASFNSASWMSSHLSKRMRSLPKPANHPCVLSTTHRCRPSRSRLSMGFPGFPDALLSPSSAVAPRIEPPGGQGLRSRMVAVRTDWVTTNSTQPELAQGREERPAQLFRYRPKVGNQTAKYLLAAALSGDPPQDTDRISGAHGCNSDVRHSPV